MVGNSVWAHLTIYGYIIFGGYKGLPNCQLSLVCIVGIGSFILTNESGAIVSSIKKSDQCNNDIVGAIQ